jgi:hypothetical protein
MVVQVAIAVEVEEGELFPVSFLFLLLFNLPLSSKSCYRELETKTESRAGNTYGFVYLFSLLLRQPAEGIGILRGGMGLLCGRSSLLVLFGAFGVEFGRRGTEAAMS